MDINIGDVFYKIEATRSQAFRSTCRICDGTKKLSVRGFEFTCPACEKEETVLSVHGYFVRRYRVYYVKQYTRDDDWKLSDSRYTEYGLYHKSGRGYGWGAEHNHISLREDEFKRALNNTDYGIKDYSRPIFSDYSLAVQQAKELTQISIDRVMEYNHEHGTNFPKPVFDIEHDKKSK